MIHAHNRRQILRALGHLAVCLFATAATFGIFFWLITIIEFRWDFPFLEDRKILIPLSAVALIYLSAIFHAWRETGFASSAPTDLSQPDSFASGSGLFEKHLNSFSANAAAGFLVLFSAGPSRLIKVCHCLFGIIHFSPSLEDDLVRLLSRINSVGEWHNVRRYRSDSCVLQYLVRMEQVEFSARKGRIKAAG